MTNMSENDIWQDTALADRLEQLAYDATHKSPNDVRYDLIRLATDIRGRDKKDGRWQLANASLHGKNLYITAHPNSEMGDPNHAYTLGYELITYTPEGLLLYHHKPTKSRSVFYLIVIAIIVGVATGVFLGTR
jgi:hypothetical protein